MATAASEPPPQLPSRRAAAPVTSHPAAATSPELDACVTSPYSAASGTSDVTDQTEQTDLTEGSVPSPGGLEWLQCDYSGGRGEASLEWQVSTMRRRDGRKEWWLIRVYCEMKGR